MNIISNNCIGGFLYKINNLEYRNPFIWHQISSNDFVELIDKYETINFNDFDIECNKRRKNTNYIISDTDVNCFHIRLSNGITFYYNHYKLDLNAINPIKRGFDIFYRRNYELTYSKYIDRLSRMDEMPAFIYFYKEPRNDTDPINDVNKMIENSIKHNYKLVLIIDFNVNVQNKNVLLIKETHLTPPHIVAKKYNKLIMDFLRN